MKTSTTFNEFDLGLPKPKNNMAYDTNAAIKKIERVLIPMLDKVGYVFKFLHDPNLNKTFLIHEYKDWSQFHKRFLEGGPGLTGIIYKKGKPKKYILVQPAVIRGTKAKGRNTHPRFNASADMSKDKTKEEFIENLYSALKNMNVYFFVVTETHHYWLDKYGSIPLEGYGTTYRGSKRVANRIYVLPEYIVTNFHEAWHLNRLKNELNQLLGYESK